MEITSHNSKLNKILKTETQNKKESVPAFSAQKNTSVLPSVYTNGISSVNSETPVSYSKICEIPVPGLENNASMFKLSNGQKVIILPKKGPTYIRTSFNVGSLNETDDIRGISHFIEHSLFNGSKNLAPGEYDKKLTSLGGYTNAFTGFKETQYYLNLQLLDDNSLEEAIKLNAYQTQFPSFFSEQIEREKEPVKSEIDMCADDYTNLATNTIIKNMFGLNSNSPDLVIGTKENINSFNREKVLDYFNTWYTPDNTVTVITGDVDVQETMNLVSKYYNKKPDNSKINKRQYTKLIPTNKSYRVDYKQNKDPGAFIQIGFPIEAGTSKSDYNKLTVLFSYIASKNSNISKVLDKYSQNLYFGTEKLSSEKDSPSIISAGLYLPEEQVEEVLKIIYEGITDLINNPPKEEDIRDLINSEIYSLKNITEYSENISNMLVRMANEDELNLFNDYPKDISSLTSQDISNIAKKFLDLNKASLCVIHPDKTPESQIQSNYEKAKNSAPVSFGQSETNENLTTENGTNISPKNISFGKNISVIDSVSEDISKTKTYKLQNNMKLSMRPSNNTANASLILDFNCKQKNKENYSSEMLVLEEMLNRGSAFKDNIAFSDIQRKLHTKITTGVTENGITIAADFPSENANEALSLLKEGLLTPNFSQSEFERAKKVIADILKNSEKSPYDNLMRNIFPDTKCYADVNEQLAALDRMTLNDCINMYNKYLYNSQAEAAFTGSEQAHTSVANQLSYGFPTFKPCEVGLSFKENSYNPNKEEILLTDTEENAQASIIRSYRYKLTGNIDDSAKIQLLNLILGAGGMSSRLFTDLRINSNLAYAVKSSIEKNGNTGIINLKIGTSTDTDLTNEADPQNINKAIAGFNRNVEKLKTEYVSAKELETAKTMLKTRILDSMEGNNDITSSMLLNGSTFYGQNYDVELLKAIDKITVEDIKAAANYMFKDPPVTSILASKKTFDDLGITVQKQ